jgi:molecular chaperone GrpE
MEWKGDDIDEADVVEPEEGGDEAVAKVKKLKDEIAQLRKEKQEYMDGWQRSKADYVNLLKRFEAETKSAKQGGVVKAVEALLPAFDALERAKEHGEIPEGFTAIAKQLESAFTSFGLSPLGTVGEAFNPAHHEAFGQDPVTDERQDDTVTAILEKGWKIGDPSTGSGQETIIRPAKVRVGKFG